MKKFWKKNTYLKKIGFIFMLFTIVVCVPFTAAVYKTACNKMVETLQDANNQSLQQMKYNYTLHNDDMASLCLSVYLENDNKGLLYNNAVDYADANRQMQKIRDTILTIYPSVYAISIYNANCDEMFSTLGYSVKTSADFSEYLLDGNAIPKLQPILRKVPYAGTENYIYVFSYLIYDYTDEENKPQSYVLLDENASWLMNNFSQISYMNSSISSRMYLMDKNHTICSDLDAEDGDQELLRKISFPEEYQKKELDTVSHVDTVSGKKYFVSRLHLNEWGDSLVMIQDYDDVFAGFVSLKKVFLLYIVIWILLSAASVVLVSRTLYRPIDNLVKFTSGLNGEQQLESGTNEFNQLMEWYEDTYSRLHGKDEASRYFMRRYQMEKLLTEEASAVWQNFCAYLPNHWIVKTEGRPIRVMRMRLQTKGASAEDMTEEKKDLFLFIIQNVMTELMEKEYPVEIFQMGEDALCGIVQASEGVRDSILEDIIRATQKYVCSFGGIHFCAAYSDAGMGHEALGVLYKQADMLLGYAYIFGEDAVINFRLCEGNLNNTSASYPEQAERKMVASVKSADLKKAGKYLEDIFCSIEAMRLENVQIATMVLANRLNEVLKEQHQLKGTLDKVQFGQIYQDIVAAASLDEVKACFLSYMENSLDILTQKKDKKQIFVSEVKKYIEEHYHDPNLSSQSVGDHMGLSGKYVMKKFQDYTGTSLNDYIYMSRMNKAAELLTGSNESISKIAEQIGILNENYFYKLFKKAYGCTPREYSNNKRNRG